VKVTDVSPQKNNNMRVSVFVDGQYCFSLDAAEAALKGIKPGKELSEKDIKNLLMDCEFSKARDYALGVLSRKSITSFGLREKLLEKGYDDIIISEVVNELTDLGYIDDQSYCQMFLEYCLEKVWGKKKIRFEMKNKGLSDELIGLSLENLSDEAFFEPMKEVIISKYGSEDLSDIKVKNKITRYFASRGFDFSQINSVLKEISDE